MNIFRAALALSLLFGISFAGESLAQQLVPRTLEIQANPVHPAPGDRVTLYAETYSFEVSRAEVTWRVNGEVVRSGVGLQTIEIFAPQSGRSTVSFSATLSGETLSGSIVIAPTTVDLIVEAQTYTPKLYRGAALPTHRAPIRIVALPTFIKANGTPYSSNELLFTWRIAGQVVPGASGIGRSVLETTAAPIQRSLDVQVDITSTDGTLSGRGFVNIRTHNPEVLLYTQNPLLGIAANILSPQTELLEDEVTIVAEPYYVAGTIRELLPISYQWRLNNSAVSTTNTDLGTITLRQAGSGRSRAQIAVSIEDPDDIIIGGGSSATFTFGADRRGIFGF